MCAYMFQAITNWGTFIPMCAYMFQAITNWGTFIPMCAYMFQAITNWEFDYLLTGGKSVNFIINSLC